MNDLTSYTTLGESRAAFVLVQVIIDMDYSISVNDGEEWTVVKSQRPQEILDALATTEADWLRIHKGERSVGTFCLVYGNADDGSELVADHTYNDECNAIWDAWQKAIEE